MVCNTFSHGRCSWLPLAVIQADTLTQSMMGSDEIVIRIIKLCMSLEHLPIFRKGQHFTTGSTIAVTHVQVVPLHVAGVDLVPAATGLERLLDSLSRPEDDLARHFHHAILLTLFMYLRVEQLRINEAFGIFSRSSRSPLLVRIRLLLGAVIGQDRFRIRAQFITKQQRGSTITSGFHLTEKLLGIVQRVFPQVADHPQAGGRFYAFPDPSVTDLVRIVLRGIDPLLLFFTNVHSSSTWAWVNPISFIR